MHCWFVPGCSGLTSALYTAENQTIVSAFSHYRLMFQLDQVTSARSTTHSGNGVYLYNSTKSPAKAKDAHAPFCLEKYSIVLPTDTHTRSPIHVWIKPFYGSQRHEASIRMRLAYIEKERKAGNLEKYNNVLLAV